MESLNQMKILLAKDKEVQNSQYHAIIQELDNQIHARFPYGAFNRVDNVRKLNLSMEEIEGYFAAMAPFEQELDESDKPNIKKLADISQPQVLGHSGFFTGYALGYLKAKYPKLKAEWVSIGEHAILVIGRADYSNPTDIKTWGPEAVLCDFWAGKYYLASNFHKVQNNSKKICFYQSTVDDSGKQEIEISKKYYFEGNPEVIEGAAAQLYDKSLEKWVKEDLKRQSQPAAMAPETPQVIKSTVAPDIIKSILSELSKCKGWKYTEKQCFAWLECTDEYQAKRVAASLKATKAAVVSEMKNAQTGVPVVKCEHLDLTNLSKLAAAVDTGPSLSLQSMYHFGK